MSYKELMYNMTRDLHKEVASYLNLCNLGDDESIESDVDSETARLEIVDKDVVISRLRGILSNLHYETWMCRGCEDVLTDKFVEYCCKKHSADEAMKYCSQCLASARRQGLPIEGCCTGDEDASDANSGDTGFSHIVVKSYANSDNKKNDCNGTIQRFETVSEMLTNLNDHHTK